MFRRRAQLNFIKNGKKHAPTAYEHTHTLVRGSVRPYARGPNKKFHFIRVGTARHIIYVSKIYREKSAHRYTYGRDMCDTSEAAGAHAKMCETYFCIVLLATENVRAMWRICGKRIYFTLSFITVDHTHSTGHSGVDEKKNSHIHTRSVWRARTQSRDGEQHISLLLDLFRNEFRHQTSSSCVGCVRGTSAGHVLFFAFLPSACRNS